MFVFCFVFSGFESIQVVPKPSHKQEVIPDSFSCKEDDSSEERPSLSRRSSSTVSVSSAHSLGRSFTVTSNASDHEALPEDDQTRSEDLRKDKKPAGE